MGRWCPSDSADWASAASLSPHSVSFDQLAKNGADAAVAAADGGARAPNGVIDISPRRVSITAITFICRLPSKLISSLLRSLFKLEILFHSLLLKLAPLPFRLLSSATAVASTAAPRK